MLRNSVNCDEKPFKAPPGVGFIKIDPDTGLLARPDSGRYVYEAYVSGTEPREYTREEGTVEEDAFFKVDTGL